MDNNKDEIFDKLGSITLNMYESKSRINNSEENLIKFKKIITKLRIFQSKKNKKLLNITNDTTIDLLREDTNNYKRLVDYAELILEDDIESDIDSYCLYSDYCFRFSSMLTEFVSNNYKEINGNINISNLFEVLNNIDSLKSSYSELLNYVDDKINTTKTLKIEV